MEKLREFFKRNGFRPTPWAVKNSIAPAVISRFLNGRGISPANAARIASATNGEVSVLDLLYPDTGTMAAGQPKAGAA
jgi:hypothetical protein